MATADLRPLRTSWLIVGKTFSFFYFALLPGLFRTRPIAFVLMCVQLIRTRKHVTSYEARVGTLPAPYGGVKRHASGRIHSLFIPFPQVKSYFIDIENTFCTQLRKKFLHFVHEKGLQACGYPSTLLERPSLQRSRNADAAAAKAGMDWGFVVDARLPQRPLAIQRPLSPSAARGASREA